jgi:broad specificity phosphatase PhoE
VTTVVFETHSTTEDNENGIMTGWLPGRLSAAGRRQAEELGARRRDDGLDAIFSSDLGRAVETVQIAFAGSGVPVFLDWRLRECDYGDLNGTPKQTLAPDERYPGGETWREAVARVSRALADLPDGRVLVVGHMATRYALERRPIEELLAEQFAWQTGWEYEL